jgi:hypothetical protein
MRPRDRSWWNHPPETAINRYGKLAEETRMRLGEHASLSVDPPQRRDGRCASCRDSRPEIAVRNGDPFCSTRCARFWHDQLAGSPSIGG